MTGLNRSMDLRKDDADDWSVVKDRRQRKRIQDRLAQRARRQRLSKGEKSSSKNSHITTYENRYAGEEQRPVRSAQSIPPEIDTSLDPTVASFPLMRSKISVELPMNIWSALYVNGDFLGIACSTLPAISPALVHPELVPVDLHPTPLQLTNYHPTWIDRFPFPHMRDRLISLLAVVDGEDFIRDIFCMESFQIKRGGNPWDPKAWIICKSFAAKWGFLFDHTLTQES